MPRSGAPARDRLVQAALELYSERGYDQTTTAEIAARAGVTERTFFRHFTDKREVLFSVEVSVREALARSLADVPVTVSPLPTVLQAFRSMAPDLESNRPHVEVRRRVIAATPALIERELAKAAALSVVVADALRARGLPDWRAALLAQVGTAAFLHAIHTWEADPSGDLDALIVQAFADFRDFSGIDVAAEPATRR
jgi:AcrR family transcriptional regulator